MIQKAGFGRVKRRMLMRDFVKFFGATCLFLAAHSGMAGGFQVNLQGVPQIGMAHCGAALVFDQSAQLFNPGGMAYAPTGVVAGFMPIFGRVTYTELAPGTYQTSNEPTMSTPFAVYGGHSFNLATYHRLGVGLAAYTPFGSRVLYADDWKGQFALREISVKAIFTQLTVGYAYKELFGIGGSFVYANGNVNVRKAIPAQFSDGSYGEANLSGKASGMGFTAGLYIRPVFRFQIGLNYRSKVVFAADQGTATFHVPNDLQSYFPNTTFSSQLPMPSTTTLGLTVHYGDHEEDVVCVDVNYVGWSAYQSLAFDFADNTEKLEDSNSPRNYHNSMIYRVGVQNKVHENIIVRGGAYLDMTPVPDGYLTPETPDAVKLGVTAGASFKVKSLRFDTAFMWVEGFKRTDLNQELNFGGTYKARAFIPCIGMAWMPQLKKEISENQ